MRFVNELLCNTKIRSSHIVEKILLQVMHYFEVVKVPIDLVELMQFIKHFFLWTPRIELTRTILNCNFFSVLRSYTISREVIFPDVL